jgi:hypothetical protein
MSGIQNGVMSSIQNGTQHFRLANWQSAPLWASTILKTTEDRECVDPSLDGFGDLILKKEDHSTTSEVLPSPTTLTRSSARTSSARPRVLVHPRQ